MQYFGAVHEIPERQQARLCFCPECVQRQRSSTEEDFLGCEKNCYLVAATGQGSSSFPIFFAADKWLLALMKNCRVTTGLPFQSLLKY
jgi:hypothetical protein